jgi:hypothetical protein
MLVTVILVALTASPVRSASAAAPEYPQRLLALPANGTVGVFFLQVQHASSYNVYRRQMGQKPEQAGSVDDHNYYEYLFVDSGPDGKGLANGTPLFYSVAAVVNGVEGPASPEVVVTPQVPISPSLPLLYYDIATLSPGQTSVDGKTLTLTGSGNGIGDQGEGQRFLATPIAGDFTLTAELLQAPRMVSGTDPTSTDEGIVGLEFRSDSPNGGDGLLPGARYALVGAFVHHDPEIVFAGQRGAPGSPPQFFSSGRTSFADAQFPLFLRLQKAGPIIRAFQSADGIQWEKMGEDQDFGPMSPISFAGLVAAAHKEGAYVAGQFDFPSVSLTSP